VLAGGTYDDSEGFFVRPTLLQGQDPTDEMFTKEYFGPILAVQKLLAQTGRKISDVDVVELNEAFAAQVIPVCDELGISIEDQLNPHGGAIALGHPFGQTGARIMGTLINDLQTLDKTIGIETMCVGGGQGMAMMIERLA